MEAGYYVDPATWPVPRRAAERSVATAPDIAATYPAPDQPAADPRAAAEVWLRDSYHQHPPGRNQAGARCARSGLTASARRVYFNVC